MIHKKKRLQKKLFVVLTAGILVGLFVAQCAFVVLHLNAITSTNTSTSYISPLTSFSRHISQVESFRSSSGDGVVEHHIDATYLRKAESTTVGIVDALTHGVQLIFDSLPVADSSSSQSATILKNLIQRREQVLNSDDVVLTTHISPNKLEVLLTQLKYWGGPASVAVYFKDQTGINQFFQVWQQHYDKLKQTSFHFVFEKNTALLYPHNLLRNVAMDAVESDYALAMDVDFIPFPKGCHDRLIQVMQDNSTIVERKKTLFILPAFQIFPKKHETHATEHMLPASKAEIPSMIQKKKMNPFHVDVPGGHGPTDFKTWFNRAEQEEQKGGFYEISIDAKESNFFEPYVLAYKRGLPRYWEEFRGFGKNKMSFFYECSIAGYKYAVLDDFYTVHLDHPSSGGTEKEKEIVRLRNLNIWSKFRHHLETMYGELPTYNISSSSSSSSSEGGDWSSVDSTRMASLH